MSSNPVCILYSFTDRSSTCKWHPSLWRKLLLYVLPSKSGDDLAGGAKFLRQRQHAARCGSRSGHTDCTGQILSGDATQRYPPRLDRGHQEYERHLVVVERKEIRECLRQYVSLVMAPQVINL